MAAEETKAPPSAQDDPVVDVDVDVDVVDVAAVATTDYATGNNWICKGCGFSNNISHWNCKACYSSMKKSIQKDNFLQRKKEKEQSLNRKKRQAKREAIKAKKSGNGPPTKESKPNESKSDEEKAPTPPAEKQQTPPFKLAPNVPQTMRALVKEEAGKGFRLAADYAVPTPAEDELLIRSFAVSICGSDAILYNWTKEAASIAAIPFIPGHEAAGLIVGVGRNCRFRIGERVAIENHFYCGECYQCSINRKDICANLKQFGHGKGTIYGGCCDYYVAKERYCYRLKADISWRDAALLEPLGVAYNACERADLNEKSMNKDQEQQKESVLIIGCGSIGCLAVGVAKTMVATGKIIAVDVFDSKLAVAKEMGADIVINVKNLGDRSLVEEVLSLTDGVGVGKIIECSGHAPTINKMFGCVRKGGCVTLVGLPKQPLTFTNPLQDIIFKSIQIRSIHGRRIYKTWNRTEKLVSERKINLDPIVSHELALSAFEEGFDALFSGKALKIVFDLTK